MATSHLNATEDDILEAKEVAASMSLETVQKVVTTWAQNHVVSPTDMIIR